MCTSTAIVAPAQVVITLFSFDGADGHGPEYMALAQGTDGNRYGTTEEDGTFGCGVVFTITPEGAQTVLHDFCSQANDGAEPYAGVIQATDGNFYGTTSGGGMYGYGAIFKMRPAGEVTTLYSFCAQGYPCSDGRDLMSPLVQAIDGDIYGTTPVGGAYGAGTAFKVTLGGALTTLYNFCAQPSCYDGDGPEGLVQGADGNLYGYAGGGLDGYGAIFRLTPTGTERIVQSFDGADGVGPTGLVAGPDGDFYGTTLQGGAHSSGTVFKLTPAGKLTTLHSFCAQRGRKERKCNLCVRYDLLPMSRAAHQSDKTHFWYSVYTDVDGIEAEKSSLRFSKTSIPDLFPIASDEISD